MERFFEQIMENSLNEIYIFDTNSYRFLEDLADLIMSSALPILEFSIALVMISGPVSLIILRGKGSKRRNMGGNRWRLYL